MKVVISQIIMLILISPFAGSGKAAIASGVAPDSVWYEYIGPNTETGRANIDNYIKYDPQPVDRRFMSAGSDILSAVRLPDNGIHPAVFCKTLKAAIETAVLMKHKTSEIELKYSEREFLL